MVNFICFFEIVSLLFIKAPQLILLTISIFVFCLWGFLRLVNYLVDHLNMKGDIIVVQSSNLEIIMTVVCNIYSGRPVFSVDYMFTL